MSPVSASHKMPDGSICHVGPGCKRHYPAHNSSLTSQISKQLDEARKAIHSKNKTLPFPEGNKRSGQNSISADWAQKLYDQSAEIEQKLDKDVSDSLRWYRMSGYRQVNALLREGKEGHKKVFIKESSYSEDPNKETLNRFYEQDKVHAENLKEAFTHEITFDNPIIVYRGVQVEEKIPDGLTALQYMKQKHSIGSVFTDKGYVSTSADSDYMSFFGRKRFKAKGQHIVYEIVTKKGLPVLEANHGDTPSRVKDGNIQSFEREILLNRNSKFRVVGIKNVSFEHSYGKETGWGSYVQTFPQKIIFPVIQLEQIVD